MLSNLVVQDGTYTASMFRMRALPVSSVTFQRTLPLPEILHCFPPIPLTLCSEVGEKVMKSDRSKVTQILAPESQISLKHFLGSLIVDEIFIGAGEEDFFEAPTEAIMKERMCSRTLLGSFAMCLQRSSWLL